MIIRKAKNMAYGKKKKYKKSTVLWSYLMLSPPIIGFLTFTAYPMLWALRLAWYSYQGEKITMRFVGWNNFINIFTKDVTYWRTVLQTFQFAIMKIPIEIPIALFIAILLTKGLKGTGFFRTMFFLPFVLSTAIVGLIFSNMFAYFGVINTFLTKLGFGTIDWFAHKTPAMWTMVISDTWHTFGINVLYFMAALSNVPKDLYEAAEMDGAGKWKQFVHVTIPNIAPVFQVILMLSIIGTLGTNDLVLVMTNGAPGGRTFTIMSYMVRQFVPGFAERTANIGYGCALSIVTALLMASVTLVYNTVSRKMNDIF